MKKNNILKSNANLKKLNEKVREQKAITLIALVITIIVLLILASVSIAMLTGENGILTKATTAKESAQRAEVIERAQIDIVAAQAENDGKITAPKLREVLNKYFDNAPETLPDDLSTVTLTTKSEYGSYSIKASEIYNGTATYKAYSIGNEVTVGGESFYVIKASDENKSTVTLLAKYNLNTAGTVQSNVTYSETACAIASTNYWSSIEGITYPYDLNNSTPSADTDAIAKARSYATKVGGQNAIGRLLTYEEANLLKVSHSSIIYGTNLGATDGYLIYWLSYTESDSGGTYIKGDTRSCVFTVYSGLTWDNRRLPGVRPVVEVSKSLIS